MQPAFHRCTRQPQRCCYFWGRHAVHITQHQDLPIGWRQRSNGLGNIVRQDLVIGPVQKQSLDRLLVERFLTLQCAQEAKALVLHHLKQPRREGTGNAQRTKTLHRNPQGFLNSVFSIFRRGTHGTREFGNIRLIAHNQCLDRRCISSTR
jgi:hypothetical protein